VDEEILRMFNVDTRYIFPRMLSDDDFIIRMDDRYEDAWGIVRARPKGFHYYEMVKAPLREADLGDIETHPWPSSYAFNEELIQAEIQRLASTGYAIFTCLAGVFEQSTYVRGLEALLTDLYENLPFFEAILDRILEALTSMYERFFALVGEHLDVIQFWGDLGTQHGPLISPDHYRRYVKPRESALVEFAKKNTNAKICLHSCGAVSAFIPDLIDAGYEILNPVQTTAADMDPTWLKREFGKDIAFWGSIDTQQILPFGSTEDVRQEVKHKIETLGPGGGYLLAPCHNIQAQTPPENVVAVFEAAKEYSAYPIVKD
jgi:uroporphyrinogen decarboxylase